MPFPALWSCQWCEISPGALLKVTSVWSSKDEAVESRWVIALKSQKGQLKSSTPEAWGFYQRPRPDKWNPFRSRKAVAEEKGDALHPFEKSLLCLAALSDSSWVDYPRLQWSMTALFKDDKRGAGETEQQSKVHSAAGTEINFPAASWHQGAPAPGAQGLRQLNCYACTQTHTSN